MTTTTSQGAEISLPPRKGVRVASILDEFSHAGFSPEADFLQLTPGNWHDELEQFQPDLLFIESAWRGKDNLWRNAVSKVGDEITGIIAWCKKRDIPTVFWNKEDPVHFSTFLSLAAHFDIVLTTDMDSVPRYKQLLNKREVYFFPFAAQTRVHNPVETFERQDAFCFAGSYYVRYPERTAALESFLDELAAHKPFIIFDRNYGDRETTHKDYQFPEEYSPYIMGRLEPSEIDFAYKGFTTGINLNSVRSSQSMLARRVYELLASNTLLVSNFSPALETLFGELVIFSERGSEVARQLDRLGSESEGEKRVRAQALRKVLREHTYQDRFRFICEKVGLDTGVVEPQVTAVARVRSQDDVEAVIASLRAQTVKPAHALFVVDSIGLWRTSGTSWLITQEEAERLTISGLVSPVHNSSHYVAVFHPDDNYGKHYLEDLLLATKYASAAFISKAGGSDFSDERVEDKPYTVASGVGPRRAILKAGAFPNLTLSDLLDNTPRCDDLDRPVGLFIDEFEYGNSGAKAVSTDLVDEGFSLQELVADADSVAQTQAPDIRRINLESLESILSRKEEDLRASYRNGQLTLSSTLQDGKHKYIYSAKPINVSQIGWADAKHGNVFVEASPGLDFMLVILFLDAEGKRLGHTMAAPNQNHAFKFPEATEKINIGFRALGSGRTDVLNIYQDEYSLPTVGVKLRTEHIILTNIYPSYDDLYRNGFVHSRVKAYQEKGLKVAVVRLTDSPIPRFREFEGVSVFEVDREGLNKLLRINEIKSILVHFLDEKMWQVIGDPGLRIPVHVWVHGSEVQPWWRRSYNAVDEEALEAEKARSEKRMTFWRGVFGNLPEYVDFVFVSRYFAEEVMEDVGIRLPEEKYRIIHNPIDSRVFNYVPKPAEQRLKVLSIRPYASRKYANDLSVAAVLDLKDEPFFDELEFRFVGDGPLFEEILQPIKDFENVHLERRFLSHREIAQYHKEHGVLLTPTRMDAQGVSRDEGMSSGLVPLTSAVAAVPEFVDEECGFLAPMDSFKELADGIRALYEDPELFERMSKAATERVAAQSEKEIVVKKEIELILGSNE